MALKKVIGGRALQAGKSILKHVRAKAAPAAKKRHRRGMFMRRGRVYVGFSSKEVKRALRARRSVRTVSTTGRGT